MMSTKEGDRMDDEIKIQARGKDVGGCKGS